MAKVLIDANNYLKRAYHGGGDPYALWFSLMNKYANNNVDVVCDTFTSRKYRKSIFPDYKKGRKQDDDPIYWELYNNCIAIAQYYSKTTVISVVEGEADDYIACTAQTGDIVISNDKDLWPLVSKGIIVLVNATTIVDRELIQIKFVHPNPEYIVVYKALVGDPSDNIKGKKGFGIKSYEKLAVDYIEGIKICLEKGYDDELIDDNVRISYKLAIPYTGFKFNTNSQKTFDTVQKFCASKGILC